MGANIVTALTVYPYSRESDTIPADAVKYWCIRISTRSMSGGCVIEHCEPFECTLAYMHPPGHHAPEMVDCGDSFADLKHEPGTWIFETREAAQVEYERLKNAVIPNIVPWLSELSVKQMDLIIWWIEEEKRKR